MAKNTTAAEPKLDVEMSFAKPTKGTNVYSLLFQGREAGGTLYVPKFMADQLVEGDVVVLRVVKPRTQ